MTDKPPKPTAAENVMAVYASLDAVEKYFGGAIYGRTLYHHDIPIKMDMIDAVTSIILIPLPGAEDVAKTIALDSHSVISQRQSTIMIQIGGYGCCPKAFLGKSKELEVQRVVERMTDVLQLMTYGRDSARKHLRLVS